MRFNIYKDQNSELPVDVLCAIGSAILLSIAYLHHEFWFISLFALVPFLWRLRHVSSGGAITLGMMLATFFVCATSVSDLIFAPKIFLLKLLSLNVVFAIFGLAIHRARKHLGFDPLFIALLWFPMEYVLIHYAGLGNLFSVSNTGSSIIVGFCSLFGILMASLAIVLINSLTLMFIEYVKEKILIRKKLQTERDNKFCLPFKEKILERGWYYFPDIRAPPLSAGVLLSK